MLDYIVDFYCHELMLVVEIDGSSHFCEEAQCRDAIRQKRIEAHGAKFLRFDDLDVKKNIGFVTNTIFDWISENTK